MRRSTENGDCTLQYVHVVTLHTRDIVHFLNVIYLIEQFMQK